MLHTSGRDRLISDRQGCLRFNSRFADPNRPDTSDGYRVAKVQSF
jgi:hypothetical protein